MQKRVFKNYIYNIIYQTLIMLLPLVSSSILTKNLGRENLGIYGYIATIGSVLTTVGLLGLNNFGIRELAYKQQDREAANKLFSQIMFLRCSLGILTLIPYIAVVAFADHIWLYLIELFYIVGMFLDPSWVFIAKEDMGKTALKNSIVKILAFVCILLLIKTENDLWIYCLIMGLSTFLGNGSLFIGLRKHIMFVKIHPLEAVGLLPKSIKLFLPQIATLLNLQIDKLMLNWIVNYSAVAIYEYSEKIINMPLTFITVFGSTMLPRLAADYTKKEKTDFHDDLQTSLYFQFMLAFPMMVGIFVCVEDLIPWLYSSEFVDCIACIRILSPIVIFNTLINFCSAQYFTATNQTKIMTISCIAGLIGNVVSNAVLIPFWTYFGAAAASVISSMITALIQVAVMSKQIPLAKKFLALLRYLLFAVIMGVVVFAVAYFSPSTFLFTILELLIGIVVYALLLFFTKDRATKRFIEKMRAQKKPRDTSRLQQTHKNTPLIISFNASSALKGLAILLVLICHIGNLYTNLFTPLGGVGVAIFLFLSGYGVSASYDKKGIKFFWLKKTIKIFVPFVFVQGVYWIISYWLHENTTTFFGFFEHPLIWYLEYLFLCYAVFYLGLSFHNKTLKWGLYLLFTIASLLFLKEIMAEQALSFVGGVLFYQLTVSHKRWVLRIKESLQRDKTRYIFSGVLFIVSITMLTLKQTSFIRSFEGTFVYAFIQLLIKYPAALACCLIAVKIQKKISFLNLLGNISFELYLIHYYLIEASLVFSSNIALVLGAQILAVALSFILNLLNKSLDQFAWTFLLDKIVFKKRRAVL